MRFNGGEEVWTELSHGGVNFNIVISLLGHRLVSRFRTAWFTGLVYRNCWQFGAAETDALVRGPRHLLEACQWGYSSWLAWVEIEGPTVFRTLSSASHATLETDVDATSRVRSQTLAGGGPEWFLFVLHRTHGRVMPVIAMVIFPV